MSRLDPRLQVVALALKPAVALAQRMALPIDELYALVEAIYLEEHLKRDLSLEQIARRIGRTSRHVSRLAKTWKERKHVLDVSPRLKLERELMLLINAEPLSIEAIAERLSTQSMKDIQNSSRALLEQEFIYEAEGKLHLRESAVLLLGEDLEAKLEGARGFVEWVQALLEQRFGFARESKLSVLRMIAFRVPQNSLEAYWSEVFESTMKISDRFAEHDASREAESVHVGVGITSISSNKPSL